MDPGQSKDHNLPSVPSTNYPHSYYHSCEGHEVFFATHGKELTPRFTIPLELAGVGPGMKVVDIGCGRGEIVLNNVSKKSFVFGIDYSIDALLIANNNLDETLSRESKNYYLLPQADARFLPIANNSIDRVFMLDIVEHLYPEELLGALREVMRILRPGGMLIIHTMPNLWYYRYGYPVYRFFQRIRGQILPANPRNRWEYSHLHVNEQTPLRLRDVLINVGFASKVWLQSAQIYDFEGSRIIRSGMNFLSSAFPFRYIFCNDIFAIGEKRQ